MYDACEKCTRLTIKLINCKKKLIKKLAHEIGNFSHASYKILLLPH